MQTELDFSIYNDDFPLMLLESAFQHKIEESKKITNRKIDEKTPVYEMAKRGVDVLSIMLDRSVSTPISIVNNYAGKVTSFVKSKPSTPTTLFKQPSFGFHS